MTSTVEYAHDYEKMLHLHVHEKESSEKLLAHYQLYSKVCKSNGSFVKCGVTKDSFKSFATFIDFMVGGTSQHSIAFEKTSYTAAPDKSLNSNLRYTVKPGKKNPEIAAQPSGIANVAKAYFISGFVGEAIPAYLIENPELKISYLIIDFDDYDSTFTTLQFFYPRLIYGGVLVLDNYHKKDEDFKAVTDYFVNSAVTFNNFAAKLGPYYFIRE